MRFTAFVSALLLWVGPVSAEPWALAPAVQCGGKSRLGSSVPCPVFNYTFDLPITAPGGTFGSSSNDTAYNVTLRPLSDLGRTAIHFMKYPSGQSAVEVAALHAHGNYLGDDSTHFSVYTLGTSDSEGLLKRLDIDAGVSQSDGRVVLQASLVIGMAGGAFKLPSDGGFHVRNNSDTAWLNIVSKDRFDDTYFGDGTYGRSYFFQNDAGIVLTIEKTTGHVGIGTADPTSPLDVNGTVRATAFKVGANVGISGTVVVKGSDGNDCNLVFEGGLLTSETCP